MWAADGQSVAKRDEETEGGAAASRNARSQKTKEKKRERGSVTGGRDEL